MTRVGGANPHRALATYSLEVTKGADVGKKLRVEAPRFRVGALAVKAARTKHPGVTVGYRIETSAGSICFVPDHESAPGENGGDVAELIAGADVVLLDAQYTADEYAAKKGWGHGCLDDMVRVARDAGVKRLFLFHHDPAHDDAFVDAMLARARELAGLMTVDPARFLGEG